MKIDFEVTKDGLTFRDAIHLEDNHTLTSSQIDAMKQARFDAWWAIVRPGAAAQNETVQGEAQE